MTNFASQSRTTSRDEIKDLPALLQDACAFATHTSESVSVHLENTLGDVGSLKEVIDEYHEIIEEKMRGVYKTDSKPHNERPNDAKLHEEIMTLKSESKNAKKKHKKLFDEVQNNIKFFRKLMNPELGPDSKAAIKTLYSKSNKDLSELIKKQRKLFSKESKRTSSKTDSMSQLFRSSSKDLKAHRKPSTSVPAPTPAANESLLKEISSLKSKISTLRLENELKDSKVQESDNLKTRLTLLKSEYEETKKSNFTLETQIDSKTSQISSLELQNHKKTTKIQTLQSELQDLENSLAKNKDTEFESLREIRNVTSQAKRS